MSESQSEMTDKIHLELSSSLADFTKEEDVLRIFSSLPLQSSADAGWKSIQLHHHFLPAGETQEFANPNHVIVIHESQQPIELEHTFDGKRQSEFLHPQKIVFLPEGIPRRGTWEDTVEFTLILLDPIAVTRTAYESIDPDRISLLPQSMESDPLIYQFGTALRQVLQMQPQPSKLYAESMATALSAHLLQYYATQKKPLQAFSGGLPKHKLRQAIDYIQAHLADDISLATIAEVVGMSQYHFSRLFKQTTGFSPYQYVIKCRVERGKELLLQKERNITDISLQVGFSSHSHFTQNFKRLIGVTPKKFVQQQ
ncbi:MAG: helix-turn-helix transcriptional regulator [Leptolyngbya sp. SIO1E4]|nr:helix-turn-helix transcriptional regulator [Leptolyngbya sp. SIO1E4]